MQSLWGKLPGKVTGLYTIYLHQQNNLQCFGRDYCAFSFMFAFLSHL